MQRVVVSSKIDVLLEEYSSFIETYHNDIVLYYTQNIGYPREAFTKFEEIKKKFLNFTTSIKDVRSELKSYRDFERYTALEDCVLVFDTIDNYSRWFKSSIFKGVVRDVTETIFTLKQNQSLSSLSREIGYENGDEGEVDISLRNKIKEMDYDTSGGLRFRYNYINNEQIIVNSVIDNLVGEKVLGRDLDRNFVFENNDIKVLSPENTFFQSCEIILSLRRGDNPQYPLLGFDKSVLRNKNSIILSTPIIIRQLYSLIAGDDTIRGVKLLNISQEKDVLQLSLELKSILEDKGVKLELYGD